MGFADQDLIAEFVVESHEGLAHVENQMLSIEAAGADVDVDLVNAVFRTMHSIKGAAGFLGLDRIGALAHGLEELLNDLRNREIVPTPELVTTMLRAADFMKGLLDAVETSNDVDVSAYVSELQRMRPHSGSTAEPHSQPAPLSDALREFVIECYENLDQMECDLVTLEQEPTSQATLRSIFRTMHTIKGGAGLLGLGSLERLAHAAEEILGALRDGECSLAPEMSGALLACVDKCREGLQRVESTGADHGFDASMEIAQLAKVNTAAETSDHSIVSPAETQPAMNSTIAAAAGASSVTAHQPAASPQPAFAPASVEAAANDTSFTTADSTIRVDVALLDKLMTRVGELVLARNQLLQYTNRLEDSIFQSTAQRLNLITTELQEAVMKTRMQPIGNVWAKFPRVVRDLAAQLGKQVRIEMEGKETELDKTIVEAIKDPLTHLIRNAIDHGIEHAGERRAAGKSAEGRLFLRAYHEGGQVNIEISDDGAGLNFERIRNKAVERGLITAEQAARMSDHEAAQLVLLPGFSTAQTLTSISGRGVGMDVVKTNIERIGGTIDMQSQAGQGTTVRIKIPLTLAIIPALIVTCDTERYAIPQVNLLELVRLEGEQARQGIEEVQGAPVYRLRGRLLPIVDLRYELGLNPDRGADAASVVNIVVLQADDRQFGLVVDSIIDTEEIVVKPLSKQLKGIPVFAGSTIMGDGKVALILDVLGVALRSHVVSQNRDRALVDNRAQTTQPSGDRQTLLLLEVGQRRLAMPIELVSRIEEVPRHKVERADQRKVIQYRAEILQLVRLSELLDIPSEEDTDQPLQVVVYREGSRSLGFVVDRIVDIAHTEIAVTHECCREDLLMSAVVQRRVTDFLNLPSIIKRLGAEASDQVLAV
jgi:two-component system chemotaxis sensor kinase CheA